MDFILTTYITICILNSIRKHTTIKKETRNKMTTQKVSELGFYDFLDEIVETENKNCIFYIFRDNTGNYNFSSDIPANTNDQTFKFDIREIAEEVYYNHPNEMTEYTILNFFFNDDIKAMVSYVFNNNANIETMNLDNIQDIIVEHAYNCWNTLRKYYREQ